MHEDPFSFRRVAACGRSGASRAELQRQLDRLFDWFAVGGATELMLAAGRPDAARGTPARSAPGAVPVRRLAVAAMPIEIERPEAESRRAWTSDAAGPAKRTIRGG